MAQGCQDDNNMNTMTLDDVFLFFVCWFFIGMKLLKENSLNTSPTHVTLHPPVKKTEVFGYQRQRCHLGLRIVSRSSEARLVRMKHQGVGDKDGRKP